MKDYERRDAEERGLMGMVDGDQVFIISSRRGTRQLASFAGYTPSGRIKVRVGGMVYQYSSSGKEYGAAGYPTWIRKATAQDLENLEASTRRNQMIQRIVDTQWDQVDQSVLSRITNILEGRE